MTQYTFYQAYEFIQIKQICIYNNVSAGWMGTLRQLFLSGACMCTCQRWMDSAVQADTIRLVRSTNDMERLPRWLSRKQIVRFDENDMLGGWQDVNKRIQFLLVASRNCVCGNSAQLSSSFLVNISIGKSITVASLQSACLCGVIILYSKWMEWTRKVMSLSYRCPLGCKWYVCNLGSP